MCALPPYCTSIPQRVMSEQFSWMLETEIKGKIKKRETEKEGRIDTALGVSSCLAWPSSAPSSLFSVLVLSSQHQAGVRLQSIPVSFIWLSKFLSVGCAWESSFLDKGPWCPIFGTPHPAFFMIWRNALFFCLSDFCIR